MSWIFLAISAHFFWAINALGDKYIVVDRMKHPYVYMSMLLMLEITAVFLIPFIDFQIPGLTIILLLILACALRYAANLCYIKALKMEDPARINVLWGLVPLFSLGLAWLIIQESLTGIQLLAIGLLVGATLIDSIHVGKSMIKISHALGLMTIACLVYAGYAVILKYALETISFTNIFVWSGIINLGLTLFALISLKGFRRTFRKEVKEMDRGLTGLIVLFSLLGNIAVLLNTWALSLGPTALVYSLRAFQTLFVFLMTIAIMKFSKIDLKESKSELNKKNILIKVSALVLMVIGITIINF